MEEIVVIGGYATITGIMEVLKQERIKCSRRTVHYWLARNDVPRSMIGRTLVVPTWVVGRIMAEYR